jgi:hypothetical protein
MTILFTNNAATTLASGINSSVTSLTVASGTGSLFPNPSAPDYFLVTLQGVAGTPIEIVKVTARSTDTFTIVRAQESTTASSFSTGDKVELRITAGGLGSFASTLNATGTGKTVLDTSPTIATPVLTNSTITGYTESVVAVGTVGASSTLSLASGTVQTATLTASTPCTFTMPTATAGTSFILRLTQAATGMTTATFTGVKWPAGTAPTITATASAVDIISFVCVNSTWYGTAAQAFA